MSVPHTLSSLSPLGLHIHSCDTRLLSTYPHAGPWLDANAPALAGTRSPALRHQSPAWLSPCSFHVSPDLNLLGCLPNHLPLPLGSAALLCILTVPCTRPISAPTPLGYSCLWHFRKPRWTVGPGGAHLSYWLDPLCSVKCIAQNKGSVNIS